MKNLKLLSILFITLLAFITPSCTRIDAGHVGLKVNMTGSERGVSGVTEVTGWVFYNPITTSVVEFPTYTQTADYEKFTVTAKGGSIFTVDPTLNYSVIPTSVPNVFTQYRKPLDQIQGTVIRNVVQDAYRLTANTFSPDSLVNNREKFENTAELYLLNALQKDGFKFERITSNLTPPSSLQEMIDAKNTAVQTALAAENKVKTAEANAKIAIATAKGDAESKKIEADGIYYYNERVQASLTPLLVEKMRIEKWDGSYPQTMLGSGSQTLFNLK